MFSILALMFLTLMIALVASLVLWVVMLIDALSRNHWPSDDARMLWIILLVVSFPFGVAGIAAIVYYFTIKRPLDNGDKKQAKKFGPEEATVVQKAKPKPKA